MKINLKQKKGITLIALVITIVVLLILAGVTIAMLTGDNGILGKATSAKNKNDEATVEEKIKLSVMYARMNTNGDTSINLVELEKELNKNFNNDVSINKKGENEALPWRVTNNGYMFEISENGEITRINGIALDKSNIKLLQGESNTITAELTQGVTGTITWTSNNANVTVTGNDKTAQIEVKENATGTATITAKIEGTEYSATCKVKVVLAIQSLSLANAEVESGNTIQLEITKTPEGETENIIFESSNNDVATVNNNGLVTAKKGITEDTEVTITAKPEKTTGKEATCTVTVKKPKGLEIGDYVEYDVTYTHMFSNVSTDNYEPYTFSKMDGWRVLDPGTNENGIYTGVKLVSTGIPAFLSYDKNSIKSFEKDGTQGKWAGDANDRRNYVDTFSLGSYDDTNMYTASGLYYNFKKILFTQGTSANSNYGYYTKVNNKTAGNLSEDEFIIQGKAQEVHNLTLAELNKARGNSNLGDLYSTENFDADTGLFNLINLPNEISGFKADSNARSEYWLATPDTWSRVPELIGVLQGGVHISNCGFFNGGYTNGVRPVITLKSGISITKGLNGVWTIN